MIDINIKNLLDLIQQEASSLAGIYERRLPVESSLPIYLGVEIPSNLYNFSFLFNSEFDELLLDEGTEGFAIAITSDAAHPSLSKFSINLLNTKYSDIFLILCSDLLNVLSSNERDERAVLLNLNKRLDYWRQFLKRSRIDKLSVEAEIGLIGELLLLKAILARLPGLNLMNHWKGPLGSTHDFISDKIAIEVKTSTNKQKRFVKISSEFQLDIEPTHKLFLTHVELNEGVKSSNSFNLISLIDDIKNIIKVDSLPLFYGLLACVGFRDSDAHFYDKKHFSLGGISSYSVIEGFPKLTNESLSSNISDVQYRLNLTGLESFKANFELVLDNFLGI